MAVFTISIQLVNGLTELCHFTTVPVCPDKVSNPLLLPVQIETPPVTFPATVAGSTVTVVGVELAVAQTPLWTTALNWVVCTNAPEM